jgi:hypothetical protein
MNKPKNENLTKKDLASRWKVSVRSVERTIKRFNLMPIDWFGRQPEFHPADVMGMEERRRRERIERLQPLQIVTVKEAKRRAGKGGAR